MRTTPHFSPEECCHLDLHIVDYCQLHCKHCYLIQGSTSMTLEMVHGLCTDFMTADLPANNRRIILNGGDALVHPDIGEIIRFVRSISGSVAFSSNGILIKDTLPLLTHSDTVQISIDGDPETHDRIRGYGNYAVAEKALHLLNRHHIPHTISFTIHTGNSSCLDHVMDLAIRTGSVLLNIGYYSPVIPSDLTPIPYSDFIRLKQKVRIHLARFGITVPSGCTETGCIGGILGISVLADGTYWDCSRSQKVIGRYPERIGDVLVRTRNAGGLRKDQLSTCIRRM